jgi:hypothetical protein
VLRGVVRVAVAGLLAAAVAGVAHPALAQERFVAVDFHNNGLGPFVWGPSRDQTIARAIAGCARREQQCSGKPAYTNVMSDTLVYACCSAPGVRCTAAFAPTAEEARAIVMKLLADAGLTGCDVRKTLSARSGN